METPSSSNNENKGANVSVSVSVRISRVAYEKLRALSRAEDRSIRSVIERIIKSAIQDGGN